jgi:hypothetical protein
MLGYLTRYVLSEFEQYLQPTIAGIQQSGLASRIKVVSSAAQLDGLKLLRSPGLPDADAGQASAFAEESGAWFGPAGYMRQYERLQGVG